MSRFILLGQTGSEELLLVDTESKTVTAVDPNSIDPSLANVQAGGGTAVRGVNVAVAVDPQQQAVGRLLFPGASH
jgi:hypothetical protein